MFRRRIFDIDPKYSESWKEGIFERSLFILLFLTIGTVNTRVFPLLFLHFICFVFVGCVANVKADPAQAFQRVFFLIVILGPCMVALTM